MDQRLRQALLAGDLGDEKRTEAERFGAAFSIPDQREGMTAFVDKRKAIFEDS